MGDVIDERVVLADMVLIAADKKWILLDQGNRMVVIREWLMVGWLEMVHLLWVMEQ